MSFSVFDLVRKYPVHAILSTLLCALTLKMTSIGRKRNSKGLPLPPGPKGFPIIGNLLDMPADKPWLIYHEWSKIYGKSFLRLTFSSNYFIFSQVTWCISKFLGNLSSF